MPISCMTDVADQRLVQDDEGQPRIEGTSFDWTTPSFPPLAGAPLTYGGDGRVELVVKTIVFAPGGAKP